MAQNRASLVQVILLASALVGAGLLAFALTRGGNEDAHAATGEHHDEEHWTRMEQRLLLEPEDDAVVVRAVTTGYADDGDEVELRETDYAALWFAAAPSLVVPAVDAFAACEPLACAFRAPLDSVVHVRRSQQDVVSFAIDVANGTAHERVLGSWIPIGMDELVFRTQIAGILPGASLKVTFRLTPGGEDAPPVVVSLRQGEETRRAGNVTMMAEDGSMLSYQGYLVVPGVLASPFEVRVDGPDGARLAARTYEPRACPEDNFDVDVLVAEDGTVSLGDGACAPAPWSSPNLH